MKHTHIFFAAICMFAFRGMHANAQTTQTGNSVIKNARTADRPLQYRPEGEDFVSVNGKNRFTRALYGGNTEFRIETSDKPVFAAYGKSNNKHIAFKLKAGNKIIALDSVEYCKSIYKSGRRDYEVKDKILGAGVLNISVQVFYDRQGAVWKFDTENLPENVKLICLISEIKSSKLNRLGDMGADPADAFEMPRKPKMLKRFETELNGQTAYVVYEDMKLVQVNENTGKKFYENSETARLKLANTLKINTPDPYINTLGGTIAMAADGCWDGEVWLHGAIGWRMPLTGWRAAYAGDALGWHDRARIHFDNYAASQVTDVEPVYQHPQQDTALNLTRALKKWGTPMYSNGYISRNPNRNNQMHHYDMNLSYIDELLWHLQWTGDLEYARKIFPVIKLHLEWEKRNWDPDNDGLYEAYASFWASDAVMYNSGGTTIGSAYNYRANRIAAELAALIGENPAPYRAEAEKIIKAVNDRLWIKDRGWWAEYVDFMGNKMLHPNAAVWTVYIAIDSEIHNIFQAYQATRYVDEYIPHIPVKSADLEGSYHTVSTTPWMPYAWSVNNVAHAEVAHTSLAYWLAGRQNEAFNLFKSAVLDGMYLGNSPANIGQVSFYDAARGECYRDFGDVVGVYSRAAVQGLFGILPDLLHNKVIIRPGFPSDWNFAEIQHPDIDYRFERKGNMDTYAITAKFGKPANVVILADAPNDKIASLKINGQKANWKLKEGINFPLVEIECGIAEKYLVEIEWGGNAIIVSNSKSNGVEQSFEKHEQGQMTWWIPANPKTEIRRDFSENVLAGIDKQPVRDFVTVNIDNILNASVTDIFKNKYLSPRSPYTTLQTPVHGTGEWCLPKLTYNIDDSGFRAAVKNEKFETPFGLTFRIPGGRNNIAFTTLWDNYPDSIAVPLSGKARYVCLLMAGTTGPMQYGVANGMVTVRYADGTAAELPLRNPETWCPIEQDYYADSLAFRIDAPRPYRVSFKTGIVTRNMETAMHLPYKAANREIDGGAGVILAVPLDNGKELQSIQWKSVANEVIIGMMGITLLK